ncbi:UbiD family decarboxylase [Methanothermobacter thermautotrophicus]|uniref:Anhydromevalonate phosphate decarboxylase n=1 Tax=Methanothermobacter thermautotrophicus TaxID=145262 RepID=A0A842YM39_METTF|nr:UbiD family decarboxylase [Methanothermobacter thermautotrophicus]MBE2900027.1 UbiD family decarboxylase [Methanothermobacter thermautotrophicus]MCQ8905379.1 UbiD family decarboxylase [Methanothermobacter sp.]
MRRFLDKIGDEAIVIEDEVSTSFEAASILREHPRDLVILKNLRESKIPVISGLCNTREKIALSLNCRVHEITQRIVEAMENPTPIRRVMGLHGYRSGRADLSELPVLRHYRRDGGPYITAGVIFARDPDTGVRNASIHRMMVIGDDRLAVRIVPRHLYTYLQRAEERGEDLEIAIAIGMDPATLLATTTSIPIDADEMEVANTFHDGELELVRCEGVDMEVPPAEIILEGRILCGVREREGPFVDLTDTYDVVRDEPVISLERMHIRDDAMYHAILPAGFEHRLLQGLPQEPRIYRAVKNTVPTVRNVVLTEGGCCWLHAAVSIKKQTEGDGKNVIMAALAAHPSLKHVVVVDDDIDVLDPEEIEYAIATRVKGDDDILIVPGARGSSLDPAALPDGTTTKVGVDATAPLASAEKFQRVSRSE